MLGPFERSSSKLRFEQTTRTDETRTSVLPRSLLRPCAFLLIGNLVSQSTAVDLFSHPYVFRLTLPVNAKPFAPHSSGSCSPLLFLSRQTNSWLNAQSDEMCQPLQQKIKCLCVTVQRVLANTLQGGDARNAQEHPRSLHRYSTRSPQSCASRK
jgi:hypothetical protein